MNTIDNITPDEKRMRLFNVNEPIELSIEEFVAVSNKHMDAI